LILVIDVMMLPNKSGFAKSELTMVLLQSETNQKWSKQSTFRGVLGRIRYDSIRHNKGRDGR